jgi:hypothetical protein
MARGQWPAAAVLLALLNLLISSVTGMVTLVPHSLVRWLGAVLHPG